MCKAYRNWSQYLVILIAMNEQYTINGIRLIYVLSNFSKILPYIRILFSWLSQSSYIFTSRLVLQVIPL